MWWSRTAKLGAVRLITPFSATASAVLHLAETLPYWMQPFTIYMDNFFSSVDLFARLRRMGIGACGTTRSNMRGTPREFKNLVRQKLGMYPYTWGYIYSRAWRAHFQLIRSMVYMELSGWTIIGSCYIQRSMGHAMIGMAIQKHCESTLL